MSGFVDESQLHVRAGDGGAQAAAYTRGHVLGETFGGGLAAAGDALGAGFLASLLFG